MRRQDERRAPEEAEVRARRDGRNDVALLVAAAELRDQRLLLGRQRRAPGRGAPPAPAPRPPACGPRGRIDWLRPVRRSHAVGGAVLRLGVEDRPVGRILRGVEAVAAADAEPVGVEDAALLLRVALGPHQLPLSCRPPHT